MSYPAGNAASSKRRYPPEKQYSGSESQYGPAPPFKRPRGQDDHTSNSAAFIPMNPRRTQCQQDSVVHKGTGNIFYKTRLCEKYMGGNCSNGEKCTFAHGLEDLHEPPPNWKEYVHDQRINRGMKICRYFSLDQNCRFGEKCNFIHQIPNNAEMAMHLPMPSIAPTGQMLEQRNDTGKTRLNKHLTCSDAMPVNRNEKPACLKTKLCTYWASTGDCPFKGNCYNAHGQSELVTPSSEGMLGVTKKEFAISNPSNNDEGPSKETAAPPPPNVTESNKLLNWRSSGKISLIYGDWLDDCLPDNN